LQKVINTESINYVVRSLSTSFYILKCQILCITQQQKLFFHLECFSSYLLPRTILFVGLMSMSPCPTCGDSGKSKCYSKTQAHSPFAGSYLNMAARPHSVPVKGWCHTVTGLKLHTS
jgi:hypothetical protein